MPAITRPERYAAVIAQGDELLALAQSDMDMAGLYAALTPDAKAAIGEQIAAARAALPAPGSTTSAVDAVIARHEAELDEVEAHLTD